MRGPLCAAVLVAVLAVVPAAGMTVEWDRTPIPVVLVVGVEQQVRFDGPATVGVPGDLVDAGALRAVFVNDTAYWLARTPFERRRLTVRVQATGQHILFDVRAVEGSVAGGVADPIEVVVALAGDAGRERTTPQGTDPRGPLVHLIRHVAQLDRAPARLVAGLEGVSQVETALWDVTGLYRHPDASKLKVAVSKQWVAGGLYVTVLNVWNLTDAPLPFDVRRLAHVAEGERPNGVSRGFVAIGIVDDEAGALGPASRGARKRLYVVTREPFDAAVEVAR